MGRFLAAASNRIRSCLYEGCFGMSKGLCKGCGRQRDLEPRQLRLYTRRKQFQFKILLCVECFAGLFDLLKDSADGFTEGLWNPVPTSVVW
jgi:hypothetical protein